MATRLESRKGLLGAEPGYPPTTYPPQPYDPTDYHGQPAYGQPTYPRPSYGAPSYGNSNVHSDATNMDQPTYNAAFASPRDPVVAHSAPSPSSLHPSKPRPSVFGFMSSKWAAMFMGVTAIQAVVCLCFES